MAYLAGQPIIILKEGTGRTGGRDAQRSNMMAARILGEIVKSTLGPRGMDKMLVDTLGDVTVTSDGATVLDEVEVQHPAAKMMVEVAKTQDDEVGDGTTTAVILTSELLRKAEELLEDDVHPTTIVSGFKKASDKAVETLNKLSKTVDLADKATLRKVAATAMSGREIGEAKEHFAGIAVEAVRHVIERRGESEVADTDNIQIVKKEGRSLLDTQLVKGMILDKEVVHPRMPKKIENARIALLDCALEVEKTEFSAEIRITDPSQVKAFMDEETRMMKTVTEKIKASGANVVLCQKGVDDMVQHFLARDEIMAVRRIKKSDMEKLSRATGAKIVTNLDDLTSETLGRASLVEERKIGDDKMIFIEGCRNPRSVAILVRAGLEKLVDEAERAMDDALSAVAAVVAKNKVVYGGGAIEVELAKRLRSYGPKVGGREQLAVEAFAETLEAIPRILAENAGLDPIDTIVALRAAHDRKTGLAAGVDVRSGKVREMVRLGVLDPTLVKEQAVKSAAEAASMIIRIDDVITAAKPPPPPKGAEEETPPY
ncbi:TCP-1/cpn60 chaperonin family protein [Candidatus Bathyarchaeota archaeon]|nr:TCP-1/cpn60 chaperonin family protein [Candidatus Bathyarchaeota archaeon]